jgi:trigger factor
MEIAIERPGKGQVKLTVEVSVAEMQPHLEKAAESLSAKHKIAGFRPGKASLGIVIQKLGAQAVWEEAAEFAVRKSYIDAAMQHDLNVLGQPHIHVTKLAADNPFVFTAEVAVLPEVTLGQYTSFKAKKEAITVPAEKIDAAIEDLREMFAKDTKVEREAQTGDKTDIDFDLAMENVPVENGSGRNHPIVIGSKQFIPGFEEQLVGMKTGEVKSFSIEFPKEYHASHLAGKKGDFTVTVKTVYQIEKPELNDEFAKQAGKFETMTDLRTKVEANIHDEMEQAADMKFERAVVEELVGRSTFGDIPELLINNEVEKMLSELKEEVQRQSGLEFSQYLENIKKSEDDLRKEFRPQGGMRVKAALIIRTVAKAETITADDKQVEEEVQSTLKMYEGSPEIRTRIDSPDYRDYVRSLQINRKVVAFLKEKASA